MAWTIDIGSENKVVGYDSESADLTHPNGEIVRERFFLVATNPRGDRKRTGSFLTPELAEAAIPYADQIVIWDDTHPEYGSPAYQDYGEAEAIEFERRIEESISFGQHPYYAVA